MSKGPSEESQPHRVVNEPHELVCLTPFPSIPLYFWGEKDGARYRKAYFSVFGVRIWAHGDLAIRLANGGFRIKGRSDATINPGGVRIGTGDYYESMKKLSHLVTDCVVVDLPKHGVVMFYHADHATTKDGAETETEHEMIKQLIRRELSPKHVPRVLRRVHRPIPHNRNLKKMEVLVRMICAGVFICLPR